MKKKIRTVIIIIIVLLILFFPIPKGTLDDGGSKVYGALTYTVVKWVYINEDRSRAYRTAVYWFPDNLKNINELKKMYYADIGKE